MRTKLTIVFLMFGIYSYSQNVTSYEYDNINRLNKVSVAPCKYIQYQYDAEGNRLSEQLISLQVKDSTVKPCFKQTNGKILVSPLLSTSRYRFTWNTGQTGQNLANIGAGAYTVSIYDSTTNATCQIQYNLSEYPNDSFRIIKKDVDCKGFQNGEVKVVRDALTTGTFKYEWSNGSKDSVLKNLSSSMLSLIISNLQTGCSKKYEIQIREPKEDIIVFPNPTKNKARLNFCTDIPASMVVSIFTTNGQLINSYTKAVTPVQNSEVVNFSSYPKGIYLVRLTINSIIKSTRIVKL